MSSDNFELLNKEDSNNVNYESVISSYIRRFREEKPTAPADRLVGPHSPEKVVLSFSITTIDGHNNFLVTEIILVVK